MEPDVKTEVFYGVENTIKAIRRFQSNAKKTWCVCADKTIPTLSASDKLRKGYLDGKARGVKIRYLTEITKENLERCKKVMEVAELRHLAGITGSFAVSESEYAGAFKQSLASEPFDVVVYSNMPELVEQQQNIFDIFWSNAIPAEQKIRELEENIPATKTEVLREAKDTTERVMHFFLNCRERMDACANSTAPSIAISVFKDAYENMKKRGVKTRWVTEITRDNLPYCKKLMEYAQVRHVDGFYGNFGVSETEYISATTVIEAQPVPALMYSNSKEMVEQQQYIFDSFWKKAIPAEQRIREIEEGILFPVETKVLKDLEDIRGRIIALHDNSGEVMVAANTGALHLVHNQFFGIYKKLMAKKANDKHKGIRWAMFIDKDSIDIVKTFLDIGMEIRHVKNMPSMYFAVSDKMYNATIETMDGGKMVQTLLTSTEPLYVQHFKSVFEELWKSGADARKRIQDIEAGINEETEVISSQYQTERVYKAIVNEASHEIMLILPTANAFARDKRIGIIGSLKEASSKKGTRVRVLVYAKEDANKQDIIDLESQGILVNDLSIKPAQKAIEEGAPRMTVVIIDNRTSLVIELKDDEKESFADAVGTSVFSTSRSIVLSYARIFESLWLETRLVAKLQESDRLQREFINIAAHELRTPVQPILAVIELLKGRFANGNAANVELTTTQLAIMDRNARRLQKLSSEILDATRIEAGTLRMDMEVMDINEKMKNMIADAKSWIPQGQSIDIQFKPLSDESGNPIPLLVKADKLRMFEVISNLIRNAIKFSAEGDVITIMTDRKDSDDDDGMAVVISVKDCGAGISAEVLPRLFTKFSADRERGGTGLGLFIAKNIVEAHGGRIWAENNNSSNDEKGATFAFTLPIHKP
ncbi:signal transduction histidine kinase [Candidatus Nitrososphaera evergladensis SR1]|uniref:Signal transduction histidine kinase n=1 Tax=Candidatus Nitrososphaera evergladensis SR1 TaxID=1459636 RepID=A0A075MUL9_9ARCH|nr:HAMP domain-containing sensor histidine kinase [Candidatus Nitrososphaera evergladensis]AIF84387.1 signal transduction histidine kinase [Candidatus Nitrososphaera evergladensis SR1]